LFKALKTVLPVASSKSGASEAGSTSNCQAPRHWPVDVGPVERWQDLLKSLRGPLAEEAARLAAMMPVQATLDFARRLASLSGENGPLADYAGELESHLEAFEADAAAAMLREFPDLAASLAADLPSNLTAR